MLGEVFARQYAASDALNRRHIKDLVNIGPFEDLCDLGCDNGEWTMELGRHCSAKHVFGVEMVAESARLAQANGVHTAIANLDEAFPFEDASFDIVHANQIIEHVKDVDHFIEESIRVLRPGGLVVISTENGSSWHNIFAAIMGWQIFSLTSVSARARSIGNPLALHRAEPPRRVRDTHRTIFNYRGLIELLGVHGLWVVEARGAGYYPLSPTMARIDVRHSHFMTVKARKVGSTSTAQG
jgi:2-polyprenyl-3-methyl-5-hydroxy-6-metoxy-1,4-benzoquinol methylase